MSNITTQSVALDNAVTMQSYIEKFNNFSFYEKCIELEKFFAWWFKGMHSLNEVPMDLNIVESLDKRKSKFYGELNYAELSKSIKFNRFKIYGYAKFLSMVYQNAYLTSFWYSHGIQSEINENGSVIKGCIYDYSFKDGIVTLSLCVSLSTNPNAYDSIFNEVVSKDESLTFGYDIDTKQSVYDENKLTKIQKELLDLFLDKVDTILNA